MVSTINGLPVFDALITDDECGMLRISLVDDPAVRSNFQAFESSEKMQRYAVADEDKRLVRGCVMRCDFPIYRNDEMGEYYIIYKADTIRQMAEKYLADGKQNLINLNHTGADVEGVQMVQYFIKGDGVSVDGFDDCPDGSLFAEFHIENDEIWNAVKAGTYKGFSLEGVFDMKGDTESIKIAGIVDALKGMFSRISKHSTDKEMSKFSKFMSAFARAMQAYGNITTDKGVLSWEGDEDVKIGDAVTIEEADGNFVPAGDGEYAVADAPQILVIEGGKVVDIRDAETEVESTEAVEEPVEEAAEEAVEAEEEPTPEAEPEAEPDPEPEAEPEPDERDARIAELEARIAELEQENATLRDEIAGLQKMSLAKPTHEEFEASAEMGNTGVKRLDNLARIVRAK